MNWLIDEFDIIDAVFINSISETGEPGLIIDFYICEQDPNESILEINNVKLDGLHEIRPILSTLYRLRFDSYISYCIRSESYTSRDDYELFEGQYFRIYSRSRFLDYIKLSTFACEKYPGKFLHYGIVGIDHIIDVASTSPPIFKKIKDNAYMA